MVADFSKNENRKFFTAKLLYKVLGVGFLAGIVLLGIADFRMYKKKQELDSQILSYKKQIEEMQTSNQNLKDQIANADNKDYLEKLAYEQLNQQRPGEKEIIFIMPEEKIQPDQEKQSLWDKVISWIKSLF